MRLGLAIWACFALGIAACSGGGNGVGDAGVDDAAVRPTLTLQHVGLSATILNFGETVTLTAEVLDEDGQPVVGAPVRWGIFSTVALDSAVTTTMATSDGAGRTSTMVVAGQSAASFDVVLSAEGADDLAFTIAVAPGFTGKVHVSSGYFGVHERVSLEARAHLTNDCVAALEDVAIVAVAPVDNAASSVTFETLIEGPVYAISVVARLESGVVVAARCVPDITVDRREDVELVAVPVDLPIHLVGPYALTLEAGVEAAWPLVAAHLAPSLVDDPERATLRALQASLALSGETDVAQALGAALESDETATPLIAALSEAEVGHASVLEHLAAFLLDLGSELWVRAEGDLDSRAALRQSLVVEAICFGDGLGPGEESACFALPTPRALSLTFGEHEDATHLPLDELRLPLAPGDIVAAALVGGPDDLPPPLAAWAGCEAFDELDALSSYADACVSAGCLSAACEAAMPALLADLMAAGAQSGQARGALTGSATLALVPRDEDLHADAFDATSMSLEWAGAETSEVVPEASLSGVRLEVE